MPAFFDGLPGYCAGKRKLAPVLMAHLASHVPQSRWPSLAFVDGFLCLDGQHRVPALKSRCRRPRSRRR